jgi:hypothetical protein
MGFKTEKARRRTYLQRMSQQGEADSKYRDI